MDSDNEQEDVLSDDIADDDDGVDDVESDQEGGAKEGDDEKAVVSDVENEMGEEQDEKEEGDKEDIEEEKEAVESDTEEKPVDEILAEAEEEEDEDVGEDVEEGEEKVCFYKHAQSSKEKKEEKVKVVTGKHRVSRATLTKYERARLIGTRACHLSLGSKPMLKNTEGMSMTEIATLELDNKVIPINIRRPLPNGKVEIWKITELEIIN
jgi:DNA-directed RNA polymerase I, II, and III subunit RPABC2